jgi:hypothetical protein
MLRANEFRPVNHVALEESIAQVQKRETIGWKNGLVYQSNHLQNSPTVDTQAAMCGLRLREGVSLSLSVSQHSALYASYCRAFSATIREWRLLD